MKFLKADEERGCCPTLRIAQIGGFFATVVHSPALQCSMNRPYILDNINFLFLCAHALGGPLWTVVRTAALNLVYPISWYDRTKLRSKINLISKTFCLLTLLLHSNRDYSRFLEIM